MDAGLRPPIAALDDSVVVTPFAPGEGLPLFLQPRDDDLKTSPEAVRAWFNAHRPALDALLPQAGALVLRGFAVPDTQAFGELVASYESMQFGYTAGASPRAQLAPRVFESTHAPAGRVLGMHQEMSYLPDFPARVAFYCRMAPIFGGETFIADMRRVTAGLDPAFIEEIERRGVLYTRNFRDRDVGTGHPHLDVMHRTWQDAFGATDPDKVLADCRAMGLGAEWLPDGSVSTTYRARGLINHPATGERLWFNQISTQVLSAENNGKHWPLYEAHYGPGKPRPYNATFGDGEAIPARHMASLYRLFGQHTVVFPWSYGDVLLLDNLLTAHGRNAYAGERDIQVALLN